MTQWLIDTLIATSGLILLVLAVRNPIRRRFGASVAYGLWLLPALRLLMPPITRSVERVTYADPALATPALTSLANSAPVSPSFVEQFGGWPMILGLVWLAGAAAMLVYGLIVYRGQRARVLRSSVQLARLGRIRIIRSEAVRGPMAFGILDPVIVLPQDFECRYDERQRRLALDHELAHHRSGDLVANLIAYVLLCLQWFNPLAWLAHTAFRFDQEAACDARVLDMVDGPDRAAYGQAIAKAASGRALLFAGALDRPKTLSRRLQTMLISSHPRRRLAGRLLISAVALAALPLTATRAIAYVDATAPEPPKLQRASARPVEPTEPTQPIEPTEPTEPTQPIEPTEPTQPTEPVEPVESADPVDPADISFIGNESVRINGVSKRWESLTATERARIRADTRRARSQLDQQMKRLPQEMAQARREMEKFRNGQFKAEMANAGVEMRQALAELDRNAAMIRATGQNPEALKAQVRASLREVETMNIDKVVRESLASVNPDKIAAELAQAQASLARVDARLDQLDRGN